MTFFDQTLIKLLQRIFSLSATTLTNKEGKLSKSEVLVSTTNEYQNNQNNQTTNFRKEGMT